MHAYRKLRFVRFVSQKVPFFIQVINKKICFPTKYWDFAVKSISPLESTYKDKNFFFFSLFIKTDYGNFSA